MYEVWGFCVSWILSSDGRAEGYGLRPRDDDCKFGALKFAGSRSSGNA